MRTFDIYTHRTFEPEAVKQGFSWPAFLFGWIWALSKDLSFPVAGLLAASIAFTGLQMHFADSHPWTSLAAAVGGIAFQVWVGRKGNSWRTVNLLKSEYEFLSSVPARSPKAALAACAGSEATAES